MHEVNRLKNLESKDFRIVSKHYQKTVQLFLTERCNFNCGFCFRREKGFCIKDMPLESAQKIISNYRNTNSKISFTGGEPSLNPDLERMLEFCSELGIDSEIYTNGTNDFYNYNTQVKLRYDGYDLGFKPMNSKHYSGEYQLGLLINGTNNLQLLKCIDMIKNDYKFSRIIQLTEVVGKDHLPVCGVELYAKNARLIFEHVADKCNWINQIEISVGALGIDAGAPKCRFERYFENKIVGKCPHDKVSSECTCCYFQKRIYVRDVK